MYPVLKAIHILSIVCWFAGLFYIFRLFVYHVKNFDKPEITAVFEIMERRLLRVIMNPAMILTYITGIWMLFLLPDWLQMNWIYVKLMFVVFVTWYHHLAVQVWKRFSKKDFYLSERSCRLINEVPTVCLVIIVFMVVLKPF
jgi:protoporphyrinogen IX oxidase